MSTTPRERPRFARRSDAISLAVVLAHFAFVLCPVFLAARVGPSPWLVVLWLWFGTAFHALLNLWHEASHALVFRERWANEFLGRWILGPLVLGDFETYRKRHWDHHRFVGQDDDTKDAYRLDLSGARLVRFLIGCLTLREAIQKLRSTGGTSQTGPGDPMWLGRAALIQALLVASLFAVALSGGRGFGAAVVATALAWGFVFFYGMASVTLFVATLRTLAEHGLFDDGSARSGNAALRNFAVGPIERLFLGAYGFAEHATHHREPAIPCYHLPEATDRLLAEGADELRRQRGGYRARLTAAFQGRPD